MTLSDRDIKKCLKSGRIVIKPIFPNAIQPASVDLHLGSDFLVFRTHKRICIDPKLPTAHMMERVTMDKRNGFLIHPGEFVLGMTEEMVGVADDMVGRLEGKSSLGRIGLIIHATAGYLDPGNKLHMTLELHNISPLPIKLFHRMPIAQMAFLPLSSAAEHPYGNKTLNSKYYGAKKPQECRLWKSFKKKTR